MVVRKIMVENYALVRHENYGLKANKYSPSAEGRQNNA